MNTFDLVLVGFGNVARRFVRLLDERSRQLQSVHGVAWRVVGIATRRHGTAFDPRGVDALAAADLVERGGSVGIPEPPAGRLPDAQPRPEVRGGASAVAFIERAVERLRAGGSDNPIAVVETTVLDVKTGQPATDHVRAALGAGAHVITANKGPVAFAFAELDALARSAGRAFLFEGAVMDGIPVFNLARETLPAVHVNGLRGVVNSTTNYIITAMENGREFEASLAEMQAAGIAEADASLDVDGWDAAAKTAALANVLMGARLTPHTVRRQGIGRLTASEARAAVARGRRIKLVSRVESQNGEVVARVAPEELPEQDLLATLRDQQNALVLETDLLGDFAIVQLGGGLTQTAYALVSDLVELGKRLAPSAPTPGPV